MLEGTIYHSDGGRTYSEFPVKLEHEKGTDTGYVKDGKFELESRLSKWPDKFNLYVGSSMVPEKTVVKVPGGVVIVLPSHYGPSKNLDAGLITGTVVQSGDPIPKCKVEAPVKGNGVFSFLDGQVAEAVTSKKGKFVLQVDGGYQVKDLTVDGKTPLSIKVKDSEAGIQELSSRLIRIGTFRLVVERKPGLFGF